MKRIDFNTKQVILDASDKLARAVGATLGAGGRNALLQLGKDFAITKDGVTVARQIEFSDEPENAVAQIIKEAAARTARDAGDGTTTSIVIAHEIIKNLLNRDSFDDLNVTMVRRGIEDAASHLIREVSKHKKEISSDEEIKNIATISGNNDKRIGDMMLDVYRAVGREGAVRLEETNANKTIVDVASGCQVESGYLNQNFANNKVKQIADYKNPVIFITDKKFEGSFTDLMKPLELMMKSQKPAIIICGGMEGEPLGTLVVNRVQHKIQVVAIQAPYFGEERMDILDDLAAITGGTVVSESRGFNIDDMTENMLGSADRIVVDKDFTTILGRHGSKEAINERVEYIKTQQEEDSRTGSMTWRLNQRLASLTSGVGVIYVGGNSESETKDMYYRLEDALSATKAALNSGYVVGGGLAYYRAANALPKMNNDVTPYAIGYVAMVEAAKQPLIWIMKNSGHTGDVPDGIGRYGYDAVECKVVDLEKRGIIDPFKVVESCLLNSASVAGMLITTTTIITQERK